MNRLTQIFRLLLLIVMFYGCKAQKSFIDHNRPLTNISDQVLKHALLLKTIDEYIENAYYERQIQSRYNDKFLITIYIKKLSDLEDQSYVLGDKPYLSSVFNTPPSYFFMYNDRIVFIYSNTEKYANPKLFTEDQVKLFNAKLLDDWNIYTDPTLPKGAILYGKDIKYSLHPKYWVIKQGKKKIVDYTKFRENEFLYHDPNYWYSDEVNLDSLRIHKGDINDYIVN
ncbi:hypothetical protein [Aquimarina brevivitae]|uniref:Uncharacterized protein n=1 Tax=Aquimarina brevivitae TaxID=323412 RepID=A0A4Q7P1I5_9FLAO|nr:hypothetical protein [Aquimarina brevivitae]RZS93178.1 hypothetical protein EV197_1748 [Aquimarina brevivitae]